jgi:ABC-2 type transport system ATP-binding protein
LSVGVELRGVQQRYSPDGWALHPVSLRIEAGVTALVGVNGAGKSTLLSTLAGSMPPTNGLVLVGGKDLYSRARKRVLPMVSLMPQALSLPENMTALEVVSVIGWMRGLTGRTAKARAQEALEAVELQDRSGSQIKELSGGMRRRVALAQAIVSKPQILLLDEPSTGLDPHQRRRMVEIIKTLTGTVFFSSHVMEDVEDAASRIIVLHEGRVAFDGSLEQLDQLAPSGAPAARRAEAAFLQVISDQGLQPR